MHLAIAFNAVTLLRRSQDNVLLLRTYILHVKSHKTPLYIVSMYCTYECIFWASSNDSKFYEATDASLRAIDFLTHLSIALTAQIGINRKYY